MPFHFKRLSIPEIILIEPKVFYDERGCFIEVYKYSDFAQFGIEESFVQDNHTKSKKNVLRGLHYQKNPSAQGKLVRCLRGKIFDVAVDIREGSSTFGQWIGVELSEENNRMLYIPPAFAHGFVVLSDTADVIYKCTKEYAPESDRGIIWNDPDINITWPVETPIVSEKDRKLPLLKNTDNNFVFESKVNFQ
ncbi:MAG: dTDP-4-dehydrorhamnose 3,5-epimerase [Candidatus Jettenia ecosi]|uniref:dTDP-4-dehydrorhamnose 3,5-epimerase n=1 Tax=Candidatus Jettenia ecosi TaxID=2494326 RepID=A0A533QIA6_9BACT|nr:MAG: dTDP-4-dehydrorhamnose 3,5-epimerase [Candidatus Jettenia ecosi]